MPVPIPLLFGLDDAVIIGGVIVIGVAVIAITYAYKRGTRAANPAARNEKE